ncbi:MAG: 30S ribosome-binding factor RbfA [Acidimicrobiia bacterium]
MSRSATPRMRKVNELLREVISDAVAGLKDPRIGFVTITDVNCAPDLRAARVFYSVLGSTEEVVQTGAALQSSAPKVQATMASQVRLKYTPVLEFQVDPSIEHGIRISKILHDLEGWEGGE